MQDKMLFDRLIITSIFYFLGNLFAAHMYPRLDIALADLPFILRIFVGYFMAFFMFLGMICFIWGIVVLLQRTRPQFYEFLFTKIFGPKQLIYIGAAMLAIPFQMGVLLLFSGSVIMILDINFHISVQPARELLFSVFDVLAIIFKKEYVAINYFLCTLITSILLIIKGNDQLKAKVQNQYYSPQVMYPPSISRDNLCLS